MLTNKFIFSALGTSLNGINGSIPATTLAGNTAEDVRFGPLARQEEDLQSPPFDLWVPEVELLVVAVAVESWGPELVRVNSGESCFDDFLGSLLRNCLNIVGTITKIDLTKSLNLI